MSHKKVFLQDIKENHNLKTSLMIMKRLYKDGDKVVYMLSDKSGQIKAKLPAKSKPEIGQVIEIDCKKEIVLDVSSFKITTNSNLEDYLPTVKRPIEDIMIDIEEISKECITSQEGISLNDYFFKDEEFIKKFKQAIGGVSMHHNYIGGLAEHTLNVMYLTKVLCDRYDCKRREIAVLSAKLHDIGKMYELDYNGPFKYTLQGELEGHISIGIQLIDRALNNIDNTFSEDFIRRIKGCIIQHHGKVEYGSPRAANMEESFILNYADTVDATMNKIAIIKENSESGRWSDYDRRIETKLYL
ncbi:HD domain-containing protein [Romboutsia sp.]|uniref:HD domain-containing protein n=1 Tax=Romboutsia sp. TaxID=1965302 RepID=UPI002CFB8DF2|nr:HD domain-containing protein [Romboutsia sp.]HSQ89809.1 HD domain-containing protein [Romboutsia sp.]